MAGAEIAAIAVPGLALGWAVAAAAGAWAFRSSAVSLLWFAVGAGFVCALLVGLQILGVRRLVRPGVDPLPGVRGVEVPPFGRPWPLRVGLDVILLCGAGLVFWLVARGGYQVVLVPEGVPATSVDWAALLAPALAWPGLALLVWRIVDTTVAHARPRRGSRDGAELITAAMRRRRRGIARAATVLAVALGVAGSTAVFTATYRNQSHLDVALTVGADVAMQLPSDPSTATRLTALAKRAPGTTAVSTQTHRFAYVGSDLQDLYGIDPAAIARATPLLDAFVPGSTISADLRALQKTPNGVLLSAETLHDYQLRPGDTVRLRLQSGAAQVYRPITFRVVGRVAEWPTAPKDSFIIANSAFVAQATGGTGATTLLIASPDPAATAGWLRSRAGASIPITDTTSASASVTTASGLAATDLGGLARLELGFGVLLAVAAFALALLVGVLQRRRALVILAALGASNRQRGRFLATEARAVLAGGLIGGVAITAAIAAMLVKVMTGIFDPPPDHPAVPWGYLTLLAFLVTVTAIAVVTVVGRWAGRAGPRELRDL
ncbi:MAG: ABC transporter permease, partial [Frankiaceae bacterium]|nr:ABC transporter permease [Frankiaceae bacterium]MBV9369645.1 ABC transporter permease [Frankiales bacterium]